MKAKKATESYKSLVEKYAAAKCEFEQKMAETAQVWTHTVGGLKSQQPATLLSSQGCTTLTHHRGA